MRPQSFPIILQILGRIQDVFLQVAAQSNKLLFFHWCIATIHFSQAVKREVIGFKERLSSAPNRDCASDSKEILPLILLLMRDLIYLS